MYSQSIPIPPVANWLCHGLQKLVGPYDDDIVRTLAIAYFALLDNQRSFAHDEQEVIEPIMVRQEDLLQYSLFYYLLHVDTNMDRWAIIEVCENYDNPPICVLQRVSIKINNWHIMMAILAYTLMRLLPLTLSMSLRETSCLET
jgi:hypothetical protein